MSGKVKSIVLVGPPGAGKSSVGRALAALLSWSFIDVDTLIEHKVAMTITEFFAQFGEAVFRAEETAVLEELLAQDVTACVVATGGGIIIKEGNFALLERIGTVICLKAEVDSLVGRLKGDRNRPLLASNTAGQDQDDRPLAAKLSQLVSNRKPYYGLAKIHIATDNLTPEQVAQQIQLRFGPT
jgi:shikimate kinase